MQTKHQSDAEHGELLTLEALTGRGWTKSLVNRFLGEPDQLKPNPRYKSAAPMRLYGLQRILQIEAIPEFIAAKGKALARSIRSLVAAEERKDALLLTVESIAIRVKMIPLSRARSQAIQNYNLRHPLNTVGKDVSEAFLQRITVNFIRHELTQYDDQLEALAGQVGRAEAGRVVRYRTLREIAGVYPELAAECLRQEPEMQVAEMSPRM